MRTETVSSRQILRSISVFGASWTILSCNLGILDNNEEDNTGKLNDDSGHKLCFNILNNVLMYHWNSRKEPPCSCIEYYFADW